MSWSDRTKLVLKGSQSILKTKNLFWNLSKAQRQKQVAEVLVKMKFKTGRITVAPNLFLPMSFAEVPEKVQGLESALAIL